MIIINGKEFEMEVFENYMDKEIAEELHKDSDVCESEQAFVDAYIKAHAEKYGEEFKIN